MKHHIPSIATIALLLLILLGADKPPKIESPRVAKLVSDLNSNISVSEKLKVIHTLGVFGADGKEASFALCNTLATSRSQEIRLATSEALEKVNPELAKLVIPICTDENVNIRVEYIHRIEKLGSDGHDAKLALLARLQRTEEGNHEHTVLVVALATTCRRDQDVYDLLLKLSQHRQPVTRLTSIEQIPKMELKDHSKGVKALVTVLKVDNFEHHRVAAAKSLGDLGKDAKDAIPQLRNSRGDKNARVRDAADAAIKQIETQLADE